MKAAGFEFPDELYYLVEHQMWARVEEDGCVRVGATSLGVHLAGEMYMCRPKAVGTVVEQGRGVAVAELAKTVVSVKTPVSGTVVEVNALLAQRPELVHQDPYGQGWIVRVQPVDFARDAQGLVHGEAVVAAMERHAWLNRAE